jgi:hypothetical protein
MFLLIKRKPKKNEAKVIPNYVCKLEKINRRKEKEMSGRYKKCNFNDYDLYKDLEEMNAR